MEFCHPNIYSKWSTDWTSLFSRWTSPRWSRSTVTVRTQVQGFCLTSGSTTPHQSLWRAGTSLPTSSSRWQCPRPWPWSSSPSWVTPCAAGEKGCKCAAFTSDRKRHTQTKTHADTTHTHTKHTFRSTLLKRRWNQKYSVVLMWVEEIHVYSWTSQILRHRLISLSAVSVTLSGS